MARTSEPWTVSEDDESFDRRMNTPPEVRIAQQDCLQLVAFQRTSSTHWFYNLMTRMPRKRSVREALRDISNAAMPQVAPYQSAQVLSYES